AWRLEPDPSPGGRHQRRGGPAAGRGPHLPERGGTGTGRRPDRPRRPVRQPGRVVPAGLMPSLWTVLREWGRLGCIGFGGPPTHIALLRQLCVERKRWLTPHDFEDAVAVCNLLPGPASTQLAIYCAWRIRGRAGALAGGGAFIVPGLIII